MYDNIIRFPRESMVEIVALHRRGMAARDIATQFSVNYNTLRRYLRLHDQHGFDPFIEQEVLCA